MNSSTERWQQLSQSVHNCVIDVKQFNSTIITKLTSHLDTMMGLSTWQLILVLLIFLLLFGRGRIPALMGDLAQGIKSFKKGIHDSEGTSEQASEELALTQTSTPVKAPGTEKIDG